MSVHLKVSRIYRHLAASPLFGGQIAGAGGTPCLIRKTLKSTDTVFFLLVGFKKIQLSRFKCLKIVWPPIVSKINASWAQSIPNLIFFFQNCLIHHFSKNNKLFRFRYQKLFIRQNLIFEFRESPTYAKITNAVPYFHSLTGFLR